ncbi:MAG: phage holin family protein [Paludibacteraceae bacterium]
MSDEQYQQLLSDTRSYLNTQCDLLRLNLLEKLSRIIGLILFALVAILLVFAIFGFSAVALAFVLAQWLPLWASFLIIGGVFLLVLVLAIVFRKQWFVNPIVSALSMVLFSDAKPKEGKEVHHA